MFKVLSQLSEKIIVKLWICPLCRVEDRRFLWATREFNLVQCNRCGLVYKSSSREVSEAAVNKELYDEELIKRRGWGRRRLTMVARRRVGVLQQYLPKGRKILEIGCGTGEFAEAAKRTGYRIEGVETSKVLAEYVRREIGIECFNGKIEDLDRKRRDYDAIAAFDVIEHVAKAGGFVQEIIRRLKEGGFIFLEMPNWRCWERLVWGCKWNMLNMRD
ncbi:MAG: hypothetical protein AMJ79_05880, partial [Phycisphaerae bacterium SM23_30]